VKFYRLNQQIRAPQLRVMGADGEQFGVLTRDEALAKAQELQVDLVEIAPAAVPPVCKLVDFKKFQYLEQKKSRDSKKNTKHSGTKELWLGPFTSDNDLQVRTERGKKFLQDGYKLRLAVKFAGRSITHPEFGWKVIRKAIDELAEFGKVEKEPKFEGKLLAATIAPGKGVQKEEKEET
jgi:translation initiation factor IF-3